MRKWGRVAAAVLALTVGACSSDPVGPDLSVELLYGAWDWVSSEGGIAGTRRTPETEGFTQQLVIAEPNRIELFRDGELVESSTFVFTPSADPEDGFSEAVLMYDEPLFGVEQQEVRFDPDGNLVLTDPCCDRFVNVFSPAASGS